MNYDGMFIGIGAFLIIGLLHPVVIKSEYYFTVKIWPLFLFLGLFFMALSLFSPSPIERALMSVFGCSLLWSIKELFEQKKRVEKGWFPENPKRKQQDDKEAVS